MLCAFVNKLIQDKNTISLMIKPSTRRLDMLVN